MEVILASGGWLVTPVSICNGHNWGWMSANGTCLIWCQWQEKQKQYRYCQCPGHTPCTSLWCPLSWGFFFFKIFIYLVERVTERRGERKWIFYLLVHYTNDCIHWRLLTASMCPTWMAGSNQLNYNMLPLRHMSRNPDQNQNRQYLTSIPTSEVGARRGSLTHYIRPCLIFWLPTSAPLAWWLNLCYPSGNLKMPGIRLQRQLT